MNTDLLEALEGPLKRIARSAVEALLARQPQGFEAYSVPIDEDAVREATRGFDVADDWELVLDETRALAVERLRALQAEGRIAALDTQGNDQTWRAAARVARHPLLRLLADAEFGAALTAEVELALAEARTLPGWLEHAPALVRHVL